MTVDKARNILGDVAKNLSENEVQAIIDCFNGIIEVGLRQFERQYKVKSINKLGNDKQNIV